MPDHPPRLPPELLDAGGSSDEGMDPDLQGLDTGRILSRSWLPGMGHMYIGQKSRGIHLLGYFLLVVFIIQWRWDLVVGGFSTLAVDRWVASLFLFGSLIGTILFSRIAAVFDSFRTLLCLRGLHTGIMCLWRCIRRRYL